MKKPGFPSARRIAVLYALFGGVWILLSDRLLAEMVSDPQKISALQTFKGWAFVGASTLLLYVAVKHEFRGRRQVEETLQRERDFSTTLIEASPVFFVAISADGRTLLMNDMMLGTLGYSSEEVKGRDYLATFVPEADREALAGIFRSLVTERKPTVNENRVLTKDGRERLVEWHGRPIFMENGDFDYFFGMGIDITGRRQAEVQAKRRLRHLAALHAVDMVITASLDLNVTLNVFLEQLTSHLHVDAAAVLSFSSHTQTLTFSAGSGFRTDSVQRTLHRLGECSAGKAALDRRTVAVFNLPQDPEDHDCTQLVSDEGFVSYFAVPLISKGNVNGVLEVYNRSPLEPDPEWVGFLESMALQAAIAIDNATLFRDIQRAHSELTMAYDTTLEGWARALEIRDKETKGHTERVVEMTLRTARAMGMGEVELVHIRRGALLHDIGKMSIPDSILFSEDLLTEEERRTMENHPRYAFDLLSPIRHLRPALDIPYCHHEKWDGSGYPRGLKGEQIPLAARIFTVVDVWDALLQERRYHPAWPRKKVREHIKSLAGTHFDPEVVKTFLELEQGG